MEKFYAFKGEEKKILTSWQECSEYLQGKKGYKYKSFSTLKEAEAYLNDEDFYEEETSKALANGYAVAYTDGSYFEGLNAYSYGVVFIAEKGEVRTFSGCGRVEEFLSSRNIAGEVLGVLTAVKWAFISGYKKLRIYHDYAGLAFWADRSWAAKSPVSHFYVKELSKYSSAVRIEFVKVKGHSNDKYNEVADEVAKSALTEDKVLPLSPISLGFKIDIDYFNDFCESLHREAPKASVETSGERVAFDHNGETLIVSPMYGCASVGGSGGFLYTLAVAIAVRESVNARETERIISTAFDIDFTFKDIENANVTEVVERLIEERPQANCARYIIFALDEIAKYLRKKLNTKKFSSLFERSGGVFTLKRCIDGGEKIEEIYNFFYFYRVNYFSLCLSGEETLEFLKKSEKLLG